MKSTSEGCRIELAKRVNKWEHVKQHFFLNSFMQVAHAHTHFFQTGCNIMTELAGFVEDIRGRVLSRQAVDVRFYHFSSLLPLTALSRYVRYCHTTVARASIA